VPCESCSTLTLTALGALTPALQAQHRLEAARREEMRQKTLTAYREIW